MLFSSLSLAVLPALLAVGSAHPRKASTTHLASKGRKGDESSSTNWCGAIHTISNVTEIEATWKVPTASSPSDKDYWNYQWVGIDGFDDCDVLLQGGTGFTTNTPETGETDYFFWYEFFPADPVFPRDITVSPGDTVYVKVTATSTTTGTIYTENVSTGKSQSYDITSDNGPLCLNYAEWITEDPSDKYQNDFAGFSNYDMTGCKAKDADGNVYGLNGADTEYLELKGVDKCDPTVKSNTDIHFTYNA